MLCSRVGGTRRLGNAAECDVRPKSAHLHSGAGWGRVILSVVGLARWRGSLASGEKVSQGSLEPLFQVRILARQPTYDSGADEVKCTVPERNAAVILAAGAGTRMRSMLPKPL